MFLARISFFVSLFCMFSFYGLSQSNKDSLGNNTLMATKDSLQNMVVNESSASSNKKKHSARIATKRSAILPGWGQAYNREYWKIPIIYGALSIPTITFFYNNSYYKKTKFAYEARYKQYVNKSDTADIANIDSKLLKLDLYSLQTYRNAFRRDRDYSVFWFLILWGVNVVDATVFGHLKDFDVSSDLSMHVEPSYNIFNNTPSINLAFNFKSPKRNIIHNW